MESPNPDRKLSERRFRTGGHRSKLLMMKQRGVYSDDIVTMSRFKMLTEQRHIQQRAQSEPIIHYKDFKTQDAPPVKFEFDYCKLTNYFSSEGDKPKSRVPFETGPGQTPRKLAIERLRREYMRIDFEGLLEEKGIDSAHMMSSYSDDWEASPTEQVLLNLPLEIFDNEDFECRTPDDWLSLGGTDGFRSRKPIPAKALLPGEEGTYAHSWQLVGVSKYCTKRHQYMVQKVLVKRSLEEEAVDARRYEEHKKSNTWGVDILVEKTEYWIPRIRVFFVAEDPRIFVQRLQFALLLKKYTEANIQYHKSVDSLPVSKATPSIENESLRRIARIALSSPKLRPQLVKKFIGNLEKRVKYEYDRTMNILIYDKELKSALAELPQKEILPIRNKECVSVPEYEYQSVRKAFTSKYLLANTEVICALSEVESECREVACMRLFDVSSETQSLEEFEERQTEIHQKMSLFLHTAWMKILSNIIRTNLEKLGKGTYNVNESCWFAYKTSNLFRLISRVRYNMQDSLRYLVLNSMYYLNSLIQDSCHSVLECQENMVWGGNLIISPLKPKKHPLFVLDLVLDSKGVRYTTPLEDFGKTIVDLFDKGILATYNVPRVDEFVMKNLFIGGDPVILSVYMWEPEVAEMRELMQKALNKAEIPLRAYAEEYTEYLELHTLEIENYVKANVTNLSSVQEVKKEVRKHFLETQRMERSLPSSITIGPFLVHVKPVREALCDKRKVLAKRTLDHFATKLRGQLHAACEKCHYMYRRLRVRPESTNEEKEKKAWIKLLPEQLESYKETIRKLLVEYEIFDEFYHYLPEEDVNKKFEAISWPIKIVKEIEAALAPAGPRRKTKTAVVTS